jgi:EAL domain-containing protein (putative c-di-GMP-specific phosphodiesterase class I)
MKASDLVFVVVMCLCMATAIGSGFYLLGGGAATVLAMVLAIFALALGQVVVFGWATLQSSAINDRFKSINSEMAERQNSAIEMSRQSDFMLAQLKELRTEANRNAQVVAAGFADLKNSYSTLAREFQSAVTSPPLVPSSQQQNLNPLRVPTAQPILSQAQFEPQNSEAERVLPFADELLVALEPIVDLNTGRTAHYRIHLGMKSDSGNELSHDAFLQQADRMGLRTQLDVFVAREAALLLRRLRQRDANLIMFMPIGAATLASPNELAQLIADRRENADIAAGLAFELPHAVLAGLSDQALEGLAALARNGILLALTNVSIAGLDLNALATLNVRYVSLEMGALGEQGKPSPTVISFAQAARVARVNVIVTDVSLPQVIAGLPQITRLAAGPCFASPRRVKRELAQQVSHSYTVAA